MDYYADFTRGKWNREDFVHAGLCAVTHRKEFEQLDDRIVNGFAPPGYMPDTDKITEGSGEIVGMDRVDYAFTFYMLNRPFTGGVTVKSAFAFDSFGAPTFTYGAKAVEENGLWVADTHIEVTVWEEGINYWHAELLGDKHRITLIKHDKFEVSGGRHYAEITFGKDGIALVLDGRPSGLESPLHDEGYVGFIGCEGMNAFYSLSAGYADK